MGVSSYFHFLSDAEGSYPHSSFWLSWRTANERQKISPGSTIIWPWSSCEPFILSLKQTHTIQVKMCILAAPKLDSKKEMQKQTCHLRVVLPLVLWNTRMWDVNTWCLICSQLLMLLSPQESRCHSDPTDLLCPERSSGEENFPKTRLASPLTSAKAPGGAGGGWRGAAQADMAHPQGSWREPDSALKKLKKRKSECKRWLDKKSVLEVCMTHFTWMHWWRIVFKTMDFGSLSKFSFCVSVQSPDKTVSSYWDK